MGSSLKARGEPCLDRGSVVLLEVFLGGLNMSSEHRKYFAVKRALDVFVSGVGLAVAGPLMVVAAALVRAESQGSPIFIQTRLGRDGKQIGRAHV